jgi:DNA-binding IclR family transcriptional regulator
MTDAEMPAAKHRTKGVDSARRTLQILTTFSQRQPELTVEDVIEDHGISLPSAYRYLSLLREMNLIEERSKGVFVLSPQILSLAQAAELTLDYRAEAQPILNRLKEKTGETSLYLRRVNDAAVCLAMAESGHPISISFQPGNLMPLHGGAGAKTLLSEYSAAKRNRYLERFEPPLKEDVKSRLRSELATIAEQGFAVSEGEVDEGVWACAAPVRSHSVIIGAISIVAPAFRIPQERRPGLVRAVKSAATELETVLMSAVVKNR